ncbi:MAG: PAS domain-containing protein [Alphaproteobacteria bacterium]|nr:PAS domain-containing protein [Alphaproteobacteria bacterium]
MMASKRNEDRRKNGPRHETGRIKFSTAEFAIPANEHLFRVSEASKQRISVLALCALAIILAATFQLALGLQNDAQTPAIMFFRGTNIVLVLAMIVLALRKADYRALDYALLLFAASSVLQTVVLQEIADPEKIGLLGRNLAVIVIGHTLLPTRLVFSNFVMTVMAVVSLIQIVVFQQFGLNEKFGLGALVVSLTVIGIVTRWQREVANRRRYRATRERNNLVAALRDSESRMRLVTDNVPAFIAYVDKEQKLRFTNQTGVDWYQAGRGEVIGATLGDLLGNNYADARSHIEAALQGEPVRFEQVQVYPDGKTRTVDIHYLPHKNEAGDVLGFFAQTFDVTDIKQSELELDQARRAAETANKSKSLFLANMSHELRTPLNAVIGFSNAMRSGLTGKLQDKQMEYLLDISTSGEHLLSLINDLLDFAKIEAGKLEPVPEEIDVDHQITGSLPLVREQAELKNIELLHQQTDAALVLNADPRMVRQMLVNLLSNAVKFSPRDSVVTISTSTSTAEEIHITVRDTGVGMAPDEIPKAIEAFEQTASGINAGGTGLGLPLVNKMMALHNGSLQIESAEGEGTAVSLRFPAYRILDQAAGL